MNSPSDRNDELQKVLALKKHEQPPSQFFERLSGSVRERIQSPEPPSDPSLRQRLGLDFDSKPVLMCAAGVGVCGLLLLGLISSRHVEPPAFPEATRLSLVPISHPNPAAVNTAATPPVEGTAVRPSSVEPVAIGANPPVRPLVAPGKESSPQAARQ